MIRRLALIATGVAAAGTPALAQDHSMHRMPGMTMPMPAKPPVRKKSIPKAPPARKGSPASEHAHKPVPVPDPPAQDPADPPAMHEMDGHAGHAMPGMAITGTALPAGNAAAPAPPADHFADRQFDPAAMARARMRMMREGGAQQLGQLMFNLAEYQLRDGKDGYRWEGEAWFGGDIHRVVIKTEGAGTLRKDVEEAEAQLLYSRAIGPYFDLQAGVRHDFAPTTARTHATVGISGLAPYMFETEAALFLSTKGDLLGRIEGWYDQRLTQRLVLQPRIELNLSAQDIPATRTGGGLSDIELGLRLRYEITREFAPYVGISHEAKAGRTADYARADRRDPTTTSFVAGIRFWL